MTILSNLMASACLNILFTLGWRHISISQASLLDSAKEEKEISDTINSLILTKMMMKVAVKRMNTRNVNFKLTWSIRNMWIHPQKWLLQITMMRNNEIYVIFKF